MGIKSLCGDCNLPILFLFLEHVASCGIETTYEGQEKEEIINQRQGALCSFLSRIKVWKMQAYLHLAIFLYGITYSELDTHYGIKRHFLFVVLSPFLKISAANDTFSHSYFMQVSITCSLCFIHACQDVSEMEKEWAMQRGDFERSLCVP